jgi:chromosome condensin MukBEF MukE localization factor
MAVRLAQALATTLADAVDSYLGASGTIKIYTGTQPATADSTATGTAR